ncbi:hypothetical protein [Clostridioides difficile]|uniref:hypothetical protein n=1 Tax=Clostridioides difficile TaxID=1496 RepID=UPI002E8DE301|nr:hypothetical protein [Clostridioides difficile]
MLNELYIRKIEPSMIMASTMPPTEYKNILNKLLSETPMNRNTLSLKMEAWSLVLLV